MATEPKAEADTTALAVTELAPPTRRAALTLAPQNMSEAMEFSRLIASSELCPKEYRDKPQSVMIAVMMGAELGITPMQALQNIAVINGRPSMWGDLLLALVQSSGLLESIQERDPQECWTEQEGRCEVVRKGQEKPTVRTYSYEMAEKAGLIRRAGDSGPWATNPGRMLQMRARSWTLRDAFADVIKGLQIREEVDDYPPLAAPIQMPRRASEVTKGQVDEFLKPTAAPRPVPKPDTPPGGKIWKGCIKGVTSRSGTTKGKPWTLYTIVGEDGTEFGTFDDKTADFAKEAGASPVLIEWEATDRGGKRIVSIGPSEG